MPKIITYAGACTAQKKPVGFQFAVNGGECTLCGSYTLVGDSAVVSGGELPAEPVLGSTFSKVGCKCCGNRSVFRCGSCGKFLCYNGHALRNFACPFCGEVGDVPAARGNAIPRSSAAPTGQPDRHGVKKLRQGEEVSLKFTDRRNPARTLTQLEIGVGWDPVTWGSSDLDSSVVVAGRNDYELIFFGNKQHGSGCVIHHGDNLTGKDSDRYNTEDDENISIYLDRVPADRDRLIFILNIYHRRDGQTLRDVSNCYIRIYDPSTRTPLVQYDVEQVGSYPSLVIGMAFRKGGGWSFKAIGKGDPNDTVEELAEDVVGRYR